MRATGISSLVTDALTVKTFNLLLSFVLFKFSAWTIGTFKRLVEFAFSLAFKIFDVGSKLFDRRIVSVSDVIQKLGFQRRNTGMLICLMLFLFVQLRRRSTFIDTGLNARSCLDFGYKTSISCRAFKD